MINTMEGTLPHRFPFRMIDRLVELEPGRRAVAVKAISYDDFFLEGHFPQDPCMPEALIVEALAQTGGIALLSAKEEVIGMLVKVEEMQFDKTKTITPGVLLTLSADVEFSFGEMAKVRVKAEAGGETVAQGILVLAAGRP